MTHTNLHMAAALLTLGLAACSGSYSGGGDGASSGGGSQARSMEEHFTRNVQPSLDFCRTCHVPGGIADVEKGRKFQFSNSKSQDLANLKASWERLGGNNPTSRILLMSSGQETPHTGGAPWAADSAQYKNMEILLKCFENPAGCAALLAGGADTGTLLPLLGSSHGGHAWFDFCEGKADDAVLPPDPRSLVQPGVNAGKAVYFNGAWKDCHVDPELVGERPHPKTCGELRARRAAGAILMEGNGVIGEASFFAGYEPNGYLSTPASAFNNLWQQWGLSARPDNFIELLAERYGSGPTAARNPYPVPKADGTLEDPNDPAHPGGTGQLPYGFLQTRNHDGSWSGNISYNCQACHSTYVDAPGLGLVRGAGGGLLDAGTAFRDAAAAGNKGAPAILALGVAGRTRGTNNASFGNSLLVLGFTSGYQPSTSTVDFLTSGTTGSNDTIAWWNTGHRPMIFQDALTSGDEPRSGVSLFLPYGFDKQPLPTTDINQATLWVKQHDQDADAWIMSQRSPAWPYGMCANADGTPGPDDAPGCVNQPLAEQGAILFHSKDLWAASLNNPAPRPEGGNGSCASCHGAYSPRYVNDPAYLDTPALEGIAAFLVPKAVIGTDPQRTDAYANQGVQDALAHTFAAYPETRGSDDGNPDTNPVQDCGPQGQTRLNPGRQPGYLAPPLYGVWASVPLFHNGSVPDVWGVLKPSDRPAIWRRVSKTARADQQGKVVMGYDTNLRRAYDPARLGWEYDDLACGIVGTNPYIDCDPADPQADPVTQQLLSQLFANGIELWNTTGQPPLTNQGIEDRKIYNTHLYSQGNEGHEFTSVLTDPERRALIEYLKTL